MQDFFRKEKVRNWDLARKPGRMSPAAFNVPSLPIKKHKPEVTEPGVFLPHHRVWHWYSTKG